MQYSALLLIEIVAVVLVSDYAYAQAQSFRKIYQFSHPGLGYTQLHSTDARDFSNTNSKTVHVMEHHSDPSDYIFSKIQPSKSNGKKIHVMEPSEYIFSKIQPSNSNGKKINVMDSSEYIFSKIQPSNSNSMKMHVMDHHSDPIKYLFSKMQPSEKALEGFNSEELDSSAWFQDDFFKERESSAWLDRLNAFLRSKMDLNKRHAGAFGATPIGAGELDSNKRDLNAFKEEMAKFFSKFRFSKI